MATLVKTFTFDSDAESFSPSDSSLTWTGGAGSPSAGCLQNVTTGRRSGLPEEWTRTLTWEALGVPAGATVTSITASGMYHRCSTWVVGDTASTQALKLVVGGTEYGLVDCGTYSGTTSWAQATGGSVDIPDQASDASVTVMIDQYARTGNNGSAAVTVQADTATFTVEYTPPNTSLTPDAISAGSAAYEPTVVNDVPSNTSLTPTNIPAGATVPEPTLYARPVTSLTPDAIPSGSEALAPEIANWPKTGLTPDAVPAGSQAFGPEVANWPKTSLTPDFIPSGSSVSNPTIENFSLIPDVVSVGSVVWATTGWSSDVTIPAHEVGDTLLVFFLGYSAFGSLPTLPEGWSVLAANAATNNQYGAWSKVSTDPGNETSVTVNHFQYSSYGNVCGQFAVVLRGAGGLEDVTVALAQNDPVIPVVTVSEDESLQVAFIGHVYNAGAYTSGYPPSGFTSLLDTSTTLGNDSRFSFLSADRPTAGDTSEATMVAPSNVVTTITLVVAKPIGPTSLSPNAIPSGSTVYEPTVESRATLTPDAIPSGSQVFNPTVSNVQRIDPGHIPSGSQAFEPTISNLTSTSLAPDHIASEATVPEPTLYARPVTSLTPDAVPPAATVPEPTIGNVQRIDPARVESTAGTFEPTVSNWPKTTLEPGTIPAGSQTFDPTLGWKTYLSPDHIPPGSAVGSPEVANWPKTSLTPDAIPAGAEAFAATMAWDWVLAPERVESTAQTFEPTIENVATTSLTPDAIPPGATVPEPTLAGYPLPLQPTRVPITTKVYKPTLANQNQYVVILSGVGAILYGGLGVVADPDGWRKKQEPVAANVPWIDGVPLVQGTVGDTLYDGLGVVADPDGWRPVREPIPANVPWIDVPLVQGAVGDTLYDEMTLIGGMT